MNENEIRWWNCFGAPIGWFRHTIDQWWKYLKDVSISPWNFGWRCYLWKWFSLHDIYYFFRTIKRLVWVTNWLDNPHQFAYDVSLDTSATLVLLLAYCRWTSRCRILGRESVCHRWQRRRPRGFRFDYYLVAERTMPTMHFADPSQPSCPTCSKQVPDRVEVMYVFCFTLPVYTKSEVRIARCNCLRVTIIFFKLLIV